MDTFLKALDLIWKMIPALKSLTGQRRSEYFANIITPLADAVDETHAFYTEIVLKARSGVVDLDISATPLLGPRKPFSAEQLAKLRAIKQEFLDARMKDEGLRDALRNEAQDIFKQINWPEEKRFLAAVMYYFLGMPALSNDDPAIDEDVARVVEYGGISMWSTPSTRIYLRIRDADNPEEIIRTLDEARTDLNQSYVNLRKRYLQVRHVLAMKT